MRFKINYQNIPVLSIGFTRSNSIIAKGIQLFSGILKDKGAANHAFLVTEDHGQLFATEETIHGLQENSLEEYTGQGNRIVAMYTWNGFNDPSKRESAQRYLAEIRRRAKENSKYDTKGLFTFVPIVKYFVKADTERQWCSENVASVLQTYGAECITETKLRPDQLQKLIAARKDAFNAVLGYYV
jgi:hypothetical protein